MDAWVALLLTWTGFVLLKWTDAAEVYTNSWAVQISGGPEEADRIAREHGFINHGNVSSSPFAFNCSHHLTPLGFLLCLCLYVLWTTYSHGLYSR